jgi:hypothetical protein
MHIQINVREYRRGRSEFRAVMSFTISMSKQCSGRLYLLLFEEGLMSYLRYLCLLVYSGVQHILCCVFVLFFFDLSLLPVSLDSPFLIAPSVLRTIGGKDDPNIVLTLKL